MKNSIPPFLQEKLNMKGSAQTRFFSPEIKEFMITYANYYNWKLDNNLTKIFKVMKMGISELPQCQYKNCKNHVYLNWDLKLTKGCSQNHSQKITYQEKYGIDCNLQLESTKKLIQETNLERYGVEYASQSPIIKEKMKQSNIKKFGVEYASQAEIIKEKVRQTNIEKFGVSNPFASNKIKSQIKQTSLEKYGVEYPMQNPDVLSSSLKNSYYYKDYQWKTGEISRVQGYEPIVLKELEDKGYSYETVFTSTKDMPEIWYFYQGKKLRYYPDFYIPSENLIIEVKSDYILNKKLEINKLKFQAVKDYGFNFKLEIR